MSDTHKSDTQARLCYMANQIARNFCALDHAAAATATADHIAQFWDPRMRAQITRDDAGLCDVARAAVTLLAEQGAPASQTRATEFNHVNETGHSDAG